MGGNDGVAPEDCQLQREVSRDQPEAEREQPSGDLQLQEEGGGDADVRQSSLAAWRNVPHVVPDELMGQVNGSLNGDGQDDSSKYFKGSVWIAILIVADRDVDSHVAGIWRSCKLDLLLCGFILNKLCLFLSLKLSGF